MFRFIFIFFLLISFSLKISSQCLNNAISAAFNFECISGDPTGAHLNMDSVLYVVPTGGEWIIVDGWNIITFKNGIPYNGIWAPGDEVKIKPTAIGLGNISWAADIPGCATGGAVDFQICLAPLPVTWLASPSAHIQNNQTQITWSVATQLNNQKYIIEYSKDGRNFSPIGEIAGDGTSNETKHYKYIHTSPSIGINYYRIKQMDNDGQYSYSDIASVRYDGD